ncbi:MAG TPA: type II secretion system F family protein [Acidimicrobiales bacterium]|nr:type II secretion system F family protein [Acidimicrobiales bacterium]
MNWTAGIMCALACGGCLLAVRGAHRAARRRAAAVRLQAPTGDGMTGAVTAHLPVPAWFAHRLADAGGDADGGADPGDRTGARSPSTLFWTWVATAAAAIAVALHLGGPGLAAIVALALLACPFLLLSTRRTRHAAKAEAALPEVLEGIARSLRSGTSLRLAFAEVAAAGGPLAGDLRRVATAADNGAELRNAIEGWGRARSASGVQLAVSALCLGIEAGGPQARAVDGVATTLRQRLGVAAEARALGAQARMSALVIALSPIAFCALASASDARSGRFLLHSGTGQLLLAAGVTLDAVGALWMTRLTVVKA